MRVLIAVGLLGFAAFCAFGFLATYEYEDAARRLPWQIGYGVLGGGSIVGAVALLTRCCGRPSRESARS